MAIADISLERAVREVLIERGDEVVVRCLTAEAANHVPHEIALLVDAAFMRRHRVDRPFRIVDDVGTLQTPQVGSNQINQGSVFSFVGTSGGVGVTTTALYSAAAASSGAVLVIDADLWHPSALLFTDAANRPVNLVATMSAQGPLRDLTARWGERVWVVGGVDAPTRRMQITADTWSEFLVRAQAEFDQVRIDLGSHLADDHPIIDVSLRASAAAVLISAAHPASAVAHASGTALIARHCTSLVHVLNRAGAGQIATTAGRILTAGLGRPADIVIPEDAAAHEKAFIAGTPPTDRRSSALQRALAELNGRLPTRR